MIGHLTDIHRLLARPSGDPDPARDAMLERVQMAIDVAIHQGLRKKKLRGRATAFGLVVQNLRDTGFFEI